MGDGPAAITFTDGRVIGATLDRNGLRPARYVVTHDGLAVLASETGVLPIKPEDVKMKGRLQPGKMFLIDLEQGRIVSGKEIKDQLANRQPYAQWLEGKPDSRSDTLRLNRVRVHAMEHATLVQRQRAFGYTDEDVRHLMTPMATNGEEPIGSMGTRIRRSPVCLTSLNLCSITSNSCSLRSPILPSIPFAKRW